MKIETIHKLLKENTRFGLSSLEIYCLDFHRFDNLEKFKEFLKSLNFDDLRLDKNKEYIFERTTNPTFNELLEDDNHKCIYSSMYLTSSRTTEYFSIYEFEKDESK